MTKEIPVPPPSERREVLRQALEAIEKLQKKLEASERARREPIAVIGMGCRFPGGVKTPEQYWNLLIEGRDAITRMPADRWAAAERLVSAAGPAGIQTPWGGFLEDIDRFDAGFFGISGREAESMDPQQRLLLEVGWEAIERAGIDASTLRGSKTGVFVGVTTTDYSHIALNQDPSLLDAYTATGSALNVTAGRIAYVLGLKGPAMAIDTACSSSLVALHLACQSLRLGESDMALAGGVNALLKPEPFICFAKWGMMAPDGRCKTFDAAADGFVRSEGCGLLFLKRLGDAEKNGDPILAVIRGSAVNQDGASSGLTVPNGLSQEAVLRVALESAGLPPESIGYVEAHGTGTSLGDPIELEALVHVLGRERTAQDPLIVGSVKTNIGHLESASGVAGAIKVILALRNNTIPPHLHFTRLNPKIQTGNTSVNIPDRAVPWVSKRIAGVSSFGFSGTNAHVILEGVDSDKAVAAEAVRPLHLLTLSAKTAEALADSAKSYSVRLGGQAVDSPGDVCFTANTGRAHFKHRLSVVGEDLAGLASKLGAPGTGEAREGMLLGEAQSGSSPGIAFLFTGQGSQYVGMGRELYETQPTFRKTLQQCDELLRPYLKESLIGLLYPEPGLEAQSRKLLDQTHATQPALFALEVALAELWRSWGVEPSAVMGHSVGEYVAACVAGLFSLEDGLKLIAERGRLMQALPPGGSMAAVFADAATVARAIGTYARTVSIAALNGPDNTVISGVGEDVQTLVERFAAEGVRSVPLAVSHAFHSPLMEPMLDPFERVAAKVAFQPLKMRLISNLTGRPEEGAVMSCGQWWRRHVREPVRFAESIKTLHEQGCRLFLEIGPHPTLLGMAARCLPEDAGEWLPSLRRGRGDWQQMLESLGCLYVRGARIDWQGFDRDYVRRKVVLPTYPFQRRRYWLSTQASPLQDSKQEPIQHADVMSGMPDASTYYIQWQSKDRIPLNLDSDRTGSYQEERWIVLCDKGGTGDKIVERLKHKGLTAICVRPSDRYENQGNRGILLRPDMAEDYFQCAEDIFSNDAPAVSGIIYLWGLDTSIDEKTRPSIIEKTHLFSTGSLLYLVQAMASVRQMPQPRVWAATRNAQAERCNSNPIAIAQTPLWGLGRVIAEELPDIWGGLIDFGGGPADEEIEAFLHDVLHPTRDNQTVYRGKRRYVARLERKDLPPSKGKGTTYKPDATYLVTGGTGGIGLCIARELVKRDVRNLVLVSRSGLTPSIQGAVSELRETGANIVVARADVAIREDIESVLDQISNSMPPLRGVIHAAGTLHDGVLLKLSWPSFLSVMASKISGAWNLHVLTQEMPLDFFVLCSSMASLTGSPGQGNYAAANAFLDGLAHYRHTMGLPALCINWGAWAGVGMTRALGDREAARRSELGIIDIQPMNGVQLLERLMNSEEVQIGVFPIEWPVFFNHYPRGKFSALFADIFEKISSGTDSCKCRDEKNGTPSLAETIVQAPHNARRDMVFHHIRRQVIQVLRLDMSQPVDFSQGLTNIGMDSLMAVELRNLLQADFKQAIPTSVMFEYPTIRELSNYIVDEFFSIGAVAPPLHRPIGKEKPDNELPAGDKSLVEMSEDEAEVSLIAELNRQGF